MAGFWVVMLFLIPIVLIAVCIVLGLVAGSVLGGIFLITKGIHGIKDTKQKCEKVTVFEIFCLTMGIILVMIPISVCGYTVFRCFQTADEHLSERNVSEEEEDYKTPGGDNGDTSAEPVSDVELFEDDCIRLLTAAGINDQQTVRLMFAEDRRDYELEWYTAEFSNTIPYGITTKNLSINEGKYNDGITYITEDNTIRLVGGFVFAQTEYVITAKKSLDAEKEGFLSFRLETAAARESRLKDNITDFDDIPVSYAYIQDINGKDYYFVPDRHLVTYDDTITQMRRGTIPADDIIEVFGNCNAHDKIKNTYFYEIGSQEGERYPFFLAVNYKGNIVRARDCYICIDAQDGEWLYFDVNGKPIEPTDESSCLISFDENGAAHTVPYGS